MIDVCLLLEGTYPYVSGGVSSWVHQLVSSMKDIRFAILYISAHSDPTRKPKYVVPPNVIYLREINLHDYDLRTYRHRRPGKADYACVKSFYEELFNGNFKNLESFAQLFRGKKSCLDAVTVLSSMEIWQLLTEFYDRTAEGISFLDFFRTWRGTHLPLLQILQAEIPAAKIYHSVSTGYAGLLGCLAKMEHDGKFFLTEHGIYTHERMLEISQASWIYEREKRNFRADRELSFFKQWWIGIFKVLSGLTYQSADRIFTLFEGNRLRQILEGAPSQKSSVIPNGINLRGFSSVQKEKKDVPQVGFVGRVVSIKDVKTFIQAASLIVEKIPQAQFTIIGPTEEEEDYYEECRATVEALHLEDNLRFTGRVNVKDYYRFMDVIVLTSLSEAQPYVILEANCMGIPVVATDVGACREMLEGREGEDRWLGPSGLLTEVSNPQATADAVIRLLQDTDLYQSYSKSGCERVKKYYDQDDLLSRYLNIYEQNL